MGGQGRVSPSIEEALASHLKSCVKGEGREGGKCKHKVRKLVSLRRGSCLSTKMKEDIEMREALSPCLSLSLHVSHTLWQANELSTRRAL